MIGRLPLSGRLGLAGVGFLAAFTLIASIAFLYPSGLWTAYQGPSWPIAWWLYLFELGDNPIVHTWLIVSAIPAVVLPPLAIAIIAWRWRHVRGWSLRRSPSATQALPDPMRSSTDNHGHARLATIKELEQLWPGPDPAYGGLVVGEKYDPRTDRGPFDPSDRATWGKGGKTGLLIDPLHQGSTHSLIVASSGMFKTVSLVSSLLVFRGSAVVLDPSSELAGMLKSARVGMQHRVFVLNPARPEIGFNVLGWIDPGSPTAEMDISAVVEWIAGTPPKGDATATFFHSKAKQLLTALIAHIIYRPDLTPEFRTLKMLRAALSVSETELRNNLRKIYKTSPSALARSLAGPLCELVTQTLGGVLANADDMTRWLAVEAFADLVSGDSFQAADIADGQTDIFVSAPLKVLLSAPALGRCIIGALLNAVYERDGIVKGRVLFALDEAPRIMPMHILDVARDCGRKFGITLMMITQGVSQLDDVIGKDARRAWEEAVSWRSYAAIKDIAAAKELSEAIGSYGVLGWSQNTGMHGRRFGLRSRSTGTTYTEYARPLLRPEEICNDLRSDTQIVLAKNCRPALIGRCLYFRRPDMAARASKNRFVS
jgi:type IV secretion system protein VirD4